MDGKCRGIQICQPADLVPGLVAILVFEVAGKVLKDEPVHFRASTTETSDRMGTGIMPTFEVSFPRGFLRVKSDIMCDSVCALSEDVPCHLQGVLR